jgi:4-hydroxybenzoate polyprenyltransferase
MADNKLIIYLKERFPAPLAIFYSVIFAFCNVVFTKKRLSAPGYLWPFIFISAIFFLFFLRLRLTDEIKDYKYDMINHPERPIAKGLIKISTIKKILFFVLLAEVTIIFFTNVATAAIYFLILIYSWLMYKDFYLKKFMDKHLLLMLLLHQFIFLSYTWLAIAILAVNIAPTAACANFFILMFTGPLLFELGRKLEHRKNANGQETNDTYVYSWGSAKTFGMIVLVALAEAFALLFLTRAGSRSFILIYFILLLAIVIYYLLKKQQAVQASKYWSIALAIAGQLIYILANGL